MGSDWAVVGLPWWAGRVSKKRFKGKEESKIKFNNTFNNFSPSLTCGVLDVCWFVTVCVFTCCP